MSDKKAVWKFLWDWGRMGTVSGIFVATEAEIEKSIGKQVYFGEALGKHSDVSGLLERRDLKLVSDDPEVVRVVTEHGLVTGYNPLEYLQDE